jgi:pyruvate/2-oxoglutarate/acetoin dehydrogenase E1 component
MHTYIHVYYQVMRAGKDVTIVTFSRMVGLALEAAEKLQAIYTVV